MSKTCTGKEQDSCNVEKMGCKGCAYNKISEDEKMLDILQSFVDLGKASCIKEDLKNDIEATEWAIKKIEKLTIERDYYKKLYLEFNNAFIEGGKTLCK